MKLGTNDISSVYLGTNEVQKVYLGTNEVWSSYAYLLDTYSGAAAAYSLRKLRSAYTGSAIGVRRASDNTEQNIGFVDNVLDTSSLTSFCSGTNGFVTTWYDQSGNGRNVTQTTASNQPQIVSSGSVLTEGGKPAAQFNGTSNVLTASTATDWNFLHQSGIFYNFSVLKIGNTSDPNVIMAIWGNSSTVLQNGAQYLYDDRLTIPRNNALFHLIGVPNLDVVVNLANNYQNANVQFLNTLYSDVSNSTVSKRSGIASNGGTFQENNAINASTSTNNANRPISIGGSPNASNVIQFYFLGNMQEMIFYPSNQSSNRTGIETNINSFYSIY
jgi:hypothetical protein